MNEDDAHRLIDEALPPSPSEDPLTDEERAWLALRRQARQGRLSPMPGGPGIDAAVVLASLRADGRPELAAVADELEDALSAARLLKLAQDQIEAGTMAIGERNARIAALEAEVAALRERIPADGAAFKHQEAHLLAVIRALLTSRKGAGAFGKSVNGEPPRGLASQLAKRAGSPSDDTVRRILKKALEMSK